MIYALFVFIMLFSKIVFIFKFIDPVLRKELVARGELKSYGLSAEIVKESGEVGGQKKGGGKWQLDKTERNAGMPKRLIIC